jgi:hypothetical protein
VPQWIRCSQLALSFAVHSLHAPGAARFAV